MLTRAIALFLVGLVSTVLACATLREAEAPGRALFDCTVTAFLPIAGTVERAEQLVADVQSRRVDLADVLDAAQATQAEAKALDEALRACVDQAKADYADAGAPDAQ
jgi:uncharacterized protein YdbL (DUF1318 family)